MLLVKEMDKWLLILGMKENIMGKTELELKVKENDYIC